MGKLCNLDLFKKKRWFENANTIWLFSTFELRRNLKTHFFPHKLEREFSEKLGEMLTGVILSLTPYKKGVVNTAKDLDPEDKQLLFEHYMPESDFSRYHGGEGFILDKTGKSYVTLNIEDHLKFHLIDTEESLEESWTKLLKLEASLSKSLEFAYSQKFGFCTSNHKKCGTGLVIRTFLHLPALSHLKELDEHLQKIHRPFFKIEGFGGNLSEPIGDLIILSNHHTLGLSEETLLKNIRRVTLELIMAEQKLREKMTEEQKSLLKDKVGKAFGALKHSSFLSIQEAYSELSLCKLGLEMDWLKGLTQNELNVLFFSMRKGYLSLIAPAEENLEKVRSEHIKSKIQSLELCS